MNITSTGFWCVDIPWKPREDYRERRRDAVNQCKAINVKFSDKFKTEAQAIKRLKKLKTSTTIDGLKVEKGAWLHF